MDPGHSDYVIVENEAEKVAREASLALKKSRSQCLPATAGTPTWTGQHGSVKRLVAHMCGFILLNYYCMKAKGHWLVVPARPNPF